MQGKRTAAVGYALFLILLILPIIVVAISLRFAPKEIPIHYDSYGEIDRYGSKYELLIVPFINVIFGLFFVLAWKKLFDKRYELISLSGANIGMLCFNAINCFLVKNALSGASENPSLKVLLVSLGVVGLLIIIFSVISIIRTIKINAREKKNTIKKRG